MKRFLTGLYVLALVGGAAFAQAPAVPWAPAYAPPVPPDCRAPARKACVPVPSAETRKRVLYAEEKVEFCLPRCAAFGGGPCGDVRTKGILMKRVVREQRPACACTPACRAPWGADVLAAPPPGVAVPDGAPAAPARPTFGPVRPVDGLGQPVGHALPPSPYAPYGAAPAFAAPSP